MVAENGHGKCYRVQKCKSDGIYIIPYTRFGGVVTLRCVSAYHEPAWHFDAKFVNGEWHKMASVQKATDHGHFLEMKNSAYHWPYDLASSAVVKRVEHISTIVLVNI